MEVAERLIEIEGSNATLRAGHTSLNTAGFVKANGGRVIRGGNTHHDGHSPRWPFHSDAESSEVGEMRVRAVPEPLVGRTARVSFPTWALPLPGLRTHVPEVPDTTAPSGGRSLTTRASGSNDEHQQLPLGASLDASAAAVSAARSEGALATAASRQRR